MKKKKNLYIIAFLCFITLVGGTLAYFTSTSTLENVFNSGKYKTITEEEFVSPTNWLPGQTIPKTITTTNEGTIPVRVRVKFEESWTSKNGDPLPLIFGDNDDSVAVINFDNTEDWVFLNDDDGGYFYYMYALESNQSTSSLINGVTLNPTIPSDVSCSNEGGVYTCESTGDGYDDATYKLKIVTETIQDDYAWNLNFDALETTFGYGYNYENTNLDDSYEDYNSRVFFRIFRRAENPIKTDLAFRYSDNVYFLEGYNYLYNTLHDGYNYSISGNYYNSNKTILQEVFGGELCSDISGGYECRDDNEKLDIIIYEDGSITATELSFQSSVSNNICKINSNLLGGCDVSAATLPQNPVSDF